MRAFSKMEKHTTTTNENLAMATKLLVARFVNSALIPYFVKTNSDLWFIKGGLAPNVFTLVASLAFLDPILVFINYQWF